MRAALLLVTAMFATVSGALAATDVPAEVPEPASYLLIAGGLLALGLLRKRTHS